MCIACSSGAVAAACEVVEKHIKLPGSIGPMVEAIVPAAEAVQGKPGDFVDNAVREAPSELQRRLRPRANSSRTSSKTTKRRSWPARYDLDEGRVEFLS